ncbi:MAG: hypothetical protein IT367_20495 [Candidatus Hydrogenedentes bacterium]|nr:hypothetical protein [Candidatus Hydrogenedentota bacterium]
MATRYRIYATSFAFLLALAFDAFAKSILFSESDFPAGTSQSSAGAGVSNMPSTNTISSNLTGAGFSRWSSTGTVKQTNGVAAEKFMHTYYSREGWKSIKKTRAHGLDGIFYRKDGRGNVRNVLVAECKSGTGQLGNTGKGYQMSPEYIRRSIDEEIELTQKKYVGATGHAREETEKDLKTLRQIRKILSKPGAYRAQLFTARIDAGVLRFRRIDLDQSGRTEKPRSLGQEKLHEIELEKVDELRGMQRKIYGDFVQSKRAELKIQLEKRIGKNANADAYADEIIDALQNEWKTQKLGDRDVYKFLNQRVEEAFVDVWGKKGEVFLVRRVSFISATTAVRVGRGIGTTVGRVVLIGAKVAKPALFVFDVGTNVFATYSDYQRFDVGEIGQSYFLFKSTLRGLQTFCTIYFVLQPEPITKGVAGITALTAAIIDVASDPIYDLLQAKSRMNSTAQADRNSRISAIHHDLRQVARELARTPT